VGRNHRVGRFGTLRTGGAAFAWRRPPSFTEEYNENLSIRQSWVSRVRLPAIVV
jgi:hypothetical protein